MKKAFFSIVLLAAFSLFSATIYAQTVKGVVVDADTNEPLIGASVVVEGTTTGMVTDVNGNFSFSVKTGVQTLKISYIGYDEQKITVKVTQGKINDLGTIKLGVEEVGLEEVKVFASIGVQRKTPVAISTIDAELVTEKIGTQEFPEILQTTPGVYATKEGGGHGDSRFNLRGFNSPNVAVMINGIPINDMEWGGVYWSNWMGMTDVLRTMQIQRGLGASKVAVPSVGGSVNIVTKTTDAKKGGSFATTYSNDGGRKVMFNISSGLTKKGWAFTVLGSKEWGDGYILGTEYEAYTYFLNISKKINDKQTLSFTGFGAPQWHNQRSSYDKYTIKEWQDFKDGYKYNATYGFGIDGQRVVSAKNFYHKPQFSLNHYWNINDESSLSSSLYYSFGTGGGYTQLGNNKSLLYGSSDENRTVNGYRDYAAIQEANAANSAGSQTAIGTSNNNHQWFGAISTYTTKFGSNIDFYGGVDLRYYIGTHNKKVEDLLGGSFFIDPTREDVTWQAGNDDYIYEKLDVGDKVTRDYDGHVLWAGTFAQAEYNKNDLSVSVSGAVSNTTYWRHDRMYYKPGEEESDKINFIGWSLKGGANYNLTALHNVFANVGYFSRAPFFSSVFLADDTSNEMNDDAKNEKVFSCELGYGFKTRIFNVNLNLYNTIWKDKSMAGALDSQDPDAGRYNATGVNAIHRGVELEAKAKISKQLTLKGMLSIGDWKWDKDVTAYVYNSDGQLVDNDGNVVSAIADAANIELQIGGLHVGDAAQTNAYIGFDYFPLEGLRVGLDYKYNARLYADPGDVDDLEGVDTWKVPGAGIFDFSASYKFKIAGLDASIRGNVNNLFDKTYIADADDGSSHTWEDATVFYGFGRTGSVGLKVYF